MNILNQKTVAALCCSSVLAGLAFWSGTSHAQSDNSPIVIGAVISATGPLAVVGAPERDSIRLAEKIINEKGGIDGRPLRIILEDDTSNPDTAVAKANGLVHTTGVKALIGGSGLATTLAIGTVTDKVKLPHVAMTGLGPEIERSRNCIVHLAPSQELNARGLLEYATKALKVQRIGVLHDSGFGQAVALQLQKLAPEYEVTFTGFEKFEVGATDTTTQAAKIRASSPEAIFIAATATTPFRNAKQVGVDVPIISTFSVATYEAAKAMGDATNGVTFSEFVVAEDPLPHQAEFIKLFEKEYGRQPKAYESLGWDAVNVVASIFKGQSKDATSEQICKTLRAQKIQGVLAAFDFTAADLGGLTVTSINYSRYSNGKFRRLPFRTEGK